MAVMKAMQDADPRIVQALAAAGMKPDQLIAQAFGGIAEKAERIGPRRERLRQRVEPLQQPLRFKRAAVGHRGAPARVNP
ncbi:MAG TPA: hypothetical protein DEH78_20015 [Solibacterales bacterium]|nr:hypothetical protein [Bryobacterales bacterium]